jgi:hypothetical protein
VRGQIVDGDSAFLEKDSHGVPDFGGLLLDEI